ncbi:BnaCnng63400D [Brassica napus]|uniref:BnaCnng63400D protein n=1 Tax=Brassica napus TaxID=3708 RepID=A0A078JSM4_BRANA|nr:BnaCnng63400D [Brassica napus]
MCVGYNCDALWTHCVSISQTA